MLFLLYLWAMQPVLPHGAWLALVIFMSVVVTMGAIELVLLWPTLTPEQRRKKIKRLLL